MEIGNCFCLAFSSGLSLSFFFFFCSIIRHKLSHYTEISPQNLTEIVASQHSQFGREMSKTLFDANSYVSSLITYGRRFETRFELILIKLSLPGSSNTMIQTLLKEVFKYSDWDNVIYQVSHILPLWTHLFNRH